MPGPNPTANPNLHGSLAGLVRSLAAALARGEESLAAVNTANTEQFQRMCHALGLSPTDEVARLCRPPEVTLERSRIAASMRLSLTETRATEVTLRIAGRLVDSFYQKRFGTETTAYQKLTVDLEKVATLDDVLVAEGSERELVRTLLRSFVTRSRQGTGTEAESSLKRAQRFARLQTFRRLLIVRSTDGWTCLLPPSGRGEDGWSSLALTRSGEVRSPAWHGLQAAPGARAEQGFAAALSEMTVPEDR